MSKILIVGSDHPLGMEKSYKAAFEQLGYECEIFDLNRKCNSFIPFKFIERLGNHIQIETSICRANQFLSKKCFNEKPLAILVFTHAKIQPGSIEYLKLFSKNVFFYWPDTIVNLTSNIFSNLIHYNKIYLHSKENVKILEKLNLKSEWLPFAGDTMQVKREQLRIPEKYDFSFIGSYRPERLHAIDILVKKFNSRKFIVAGPGWKKSKNDWENVSILDEMISMDKFIDLTRQSKIALNIIDHLNSPSSNLRFFEIGLSERPQISTFVSEFENMFVHGKHVFYFKTDEELLMNAEYILNNYESSSQCGYRLRDIIDKSNSYLCRAHEIVSAFIF